MRHALTQAPRHSAVVMLRGGLLAGCAFRAHAQQRAHFWPLLCVEL